MITTAEPSLSDLWRRQIGRRCRQEGPRPLASLGYLTNGPVVEGLIDVESLCLVVVHDEISLRGNMTTRVAGYSARPMPHGVRFGGQENSRLLKDLRLQPMAGAWGRRLDTASESLLRLALQLDREIQRHRFYGRRLKYPQLRLPNLWAGFRPADADWLEGDGPELAEYCRRTGRSARDVLAALRRDHFGLAIVPMTWVSTAWQQAMAVFADLRRFPLRQVFPIAPLPDSLVGFQGVSEYDFMSTRFHSSMSQPQDAAGPAVSSLPG